MRPDELAHAYLDALTVADVDAVLGLFADDGIVHSPLYGVLPATEFYPRLFADTGKAELTLRSAMSGTAEDGRAVVSFWFHFDWRLASGTAAPFDVVDVAVLDTTGDIVELHIVYDTVDVRPKFNRETS